MQYKLISSVYIDDLNSAVNKKLADGWQLFGVTFARGTKVCQAVIKHPSTGVSTGRVKDGAWVRETAAPAPGKDPT